MAEGEENKSAEILNKRIAESLQQLLDTLRIDEWKRALDEFKNNLRTAAEHFRIEQDTNQQKILRERQDKRPGERNNEAYLSWVL